MKKRCYYYAHKYTNNTSEIIPVIWVSWSTKKDTIYVSNNSEVYGMGNRLRILRKTRNLTQEVVSSELGISQQTLSRCEIDITTLQIDLLYKIAQYYNVSTDYILGLSDNKWTTEQNILVNQFFLKYQDIFEAFEALDDYDKELIRGLIAQMKKIKNERY